MEAGEVLDGRYELLSTLGRGGMGVVWMARHRWLTNREYAVKVIADHIAGDPDAVARFTREARAMADLGGHPNVAEVLDFGVDGSGRFYLVMELLAGQDLSALIGRGPLLPENALRIVSEAAAGLAYAHAAGLVHRDVKPANLFVAGDGVVRVLDFGLARAVDSSGTVTRGAGTWQYMAPEQFDDDFGDVGPVTDVYGLTGVLLHALTGRPSFPDTTSMPQLYVAHTRKPRPCPSERDPGLVWLDPVVARGMAIDSAERYQSVTELAEAATEAWRKSEGSIVASARPVADSARADADAEFERLRAAAEGGDAVAMNRFGLLLAKRGDEHGAEGWYRKAANNGNTIAMVNLGLWLEASGDVRGAEQWYRKAADAGFGEAMVRLGKFLEDRGDISEAESWLENAAAVGHVFAMVKLGLRVHARGDARSAEDWFRKAAAAGDDHAMTLLAATLNAKGDEEGAEGWIRQAATAGNPAAMNRLGVILWERREVTEAKEWIRKAAESGNEDALQNLRRITPP